MKNKKMLNSLIFALLILVSCSDADTTVDQTHSDSGSDTVSTEETTGYTLPSYDYTGETFNILNDAATLVTGENGDILNDAKWQMQRTVEDAFHITITETTHDRYDMTTYANQMVMSGDTTYDTIAVMDRFALSVAMENLVLPMNDIDTIHLDEPYWGGKLSDDISICNNTYFGINSSSLSTFTRVSCCLINTDLAAALDYQIPYDEIDEGKWTYDDLYALRGVATQDINGDSVMDLSDQWTFGTFDFRDLALQLSVSMNEFTVEKDQNGIPYVSVYDDERYINVMQAIYNLCYSGTDNIQDALNMTDNFRMNQPFVEGKVLVMFSRFAELTQYRDMENDFCVVPMPKYDEAQENYCSRTYDATFYMIPTTQENSAYAGTVLDALSMVGYYDMLPVYVNSVLQDKIARDEASQKYIQLCFDTRTIDIGLTYLNSYFNGEILHQNGLSGSSMNLASYFEQIRNGADQELGGIIERFTSIIE